ncbi:Myc-associated zinc finger protein [Folsomia candida]|uniref:Myc-associated zinc finger protein n=1 Tax=Folsomia candida TaxID=158441 RepID=A0A226EBE2_FOLCA|nr:Myc-associated zinc finger protein [Folsomia candida]
MRTLALVILFMGVMVLLAEAYFADEEDNYFGGVPRRVRRHHYYHGDVIFTPHGPLFGYRYGPREPVPPADSDSDSAPNPLKCSICFKKFGTVDTKERHFRHMHDETFTRLPCPADDCDLSFKRRDHLHRHLKRKHPTVPFFTMGSRSRPVRKDDFENIGDRIPCPVATCEKTYSRTDHLNIHIRTTHPDTPVIKGSKKGKKYGSKVPETKPCPVCEKEIKSSRLKEHMETHASGVSF